MRFGRDIHQQSRPRDEERASARLMGEAVEGMPWLGTFHAICAKLLRRHAELVGLKSNFTILDTDDQIRLMKQLIVAAGIDRQTLACADVVGDHRWLEEQRADPRQDAGGG